MAKLTFLGAAGCVTGSKYLLEAGGKKLLIDCGMFQGSEELKQRNFQPCPVDPRTIDFLVLTHAHLDHTGWLPVLVKQGYSKTIYANSATMELTGILLRDSAHLQEEDSERAKRKGYHQHLEHTPLYGPTDIDPLLKLMKEMPRSGAAFDISPEFRVVGYDAGHIIGSSSLEITVTENGKKFIIVFSGDIGRYGQPILKDPTTPSRADYLVLESTYGDRDHAPGSPRQALADVVNRVAKRGGVLVFPAFAIGRTQTMMYYLRQLEDLQQIPRLPVYIDSPMALSATDLYLRHAEDHNAEFAADEKGGEGDPLNVHEFHLTRTADESKKINDVKTPCIIISASGMASGGRVLHHLAQRLPDARNAVVLAGFQAEGTNGRALLSGAKVLHIFGQAVPVLAEIVELGQFSAHAGKSELLRWAQTLSAPPRQTFLTHGEPEGAKSLQASLQGLKWSASVPQHLSSAELAAP